MSRDPIGGLGGLSEMGFVLNDPVQLFDDKGNAPMSGGIGGPQLIPPGGFPRYRPPAPPVEGGGGIGGYLIFGAEGALSVTTCCVKGEKYRVVVATACSGLGASVGIGKSKVGKGKVGKSKVKVDPPSGPGPGGSLALSDGTCPLLVRHYVKLVFSLGPLEKGWNFVDEGDEIEGVSEIALPPSVGVRYVYCSDSVISKIRIGCCPP